MRNKTKLYQYIFRTTFISFCLIVTLISITQVFAESNTVSNSSSATASVTVSSACSFSRTNESDGNYTGILANNSSVEISGSTFTTFCNDPGGYAIYAVGYSNDTFGNTDLIYNDTPNSSNNIKTDGNNIAGGNGSHWGMSLSSSESGKPSIESGFSDSNNPHIIPSTYTKIASYNTTTAGINTDTSQEELLGQSVTVTYSATASSTQPAGTYTGAVKYTMVHPSTTTAPTITIEDLHYMQDFATLSPANKTDLLNSMPTGAQYQLIDNRDSKSYYISKLADGNIWMTQNLDLDITSDPTAENYIALTSENTDLSSDQSVYTANNTVYALKGENDTYGYTYENGIATWMPERGTIAYNQLSGTTWANDSNHPYSYDRLDTSTGAPVYPDSKVSQVIAGDHGLSGNYYNWTASVASNDTSSLQSGNKNASNSICPKGWRLPNITNKDFGNLLVQYGIIQNNTDMTYLDGGFNKMGAAPLYLVLGGSINSASFYRSGSTGSYYSSTTRGFTNVYYMSFYGGQVEPQAYDGQRDRGRSIRCLARTED